MSNRSERYEYRVYYRRSAWTCAQSRFFQSEPPALRFMAKVRGDGRPDLSPLTQLQCERRAVGPWEATA